MEFDAFISHASEDKDDVARPLAQELMKLGYSIWYDEFSLKIGDSLRNSINRGLSNSRFGIVILSVPFLEKRWTNYELDGLTAKENRHGEKVILPIWHNISVSEIEKYSLTLLDRLAATTDGGLSNAIAKIVDVLGKPLNENAASSEESKKQRQEIETANLKSRFTIDLYNEWHSLKMRESRIYVSAWTKELYEKKIPIPSLSTIEKNGGQDEYHVFHLIHFFEKWAQLSKNNVVDKFLLLKLLDSYLVWYETNLIDPLLLADERNQDFKNLLKVIKKWVFPSN